MQLPTTTRMSENLSNYRQIMGARISLALLLTSLILIPAFTGCFGKDDEENGLYAGFTDGALGLRLRYEISRQFAPYIGVEWTRAFGKTADMADDAGAPVTDTHYLAGIKFWF